MDRICFAVLEKICSLAAVGRFVVFSEEELFDAFPDGEKRNEAVLHGALKTLKEYGFIDLKYSSGNLYCIAPLKKYEPAPTPEKEEIIIEEKDICNPKKNNNYIIKLHGNIDKLSTIVLKEQDYLGFSETHKLIEPFFKLILAGYTILFIGYSLNDYKAYEF